ncbi:uncharacterized protein PSFLO_01096 [Pseudozyma flocculosa]|uniref:Uncharacterized protein n=1 Tax=Pseudozyma flocculosa TaxID=84751 RepID=A0A5C3EV66_9BASI|nr:uncharacterized protein PSFLO_01096 [Pseudozyma flocculosa]
MSCAVMVNSKPALKLWNHDLVATLNFERILNAFLAGKEHP